MRNVRCSGNAVATASLIARLDRRSWPSGFSNASLTFGPVKPAERSPEMVAANSVGAVDRKMPSSCPSLIARSARGANRSLSVASTDT